MQRLRFNNFWTALAKKKKICPNPFPKEFESHVESDALEETDND